MTGRDLIGAKGRVGGGRRRAPNFAMRPLALALAASSLLSFPPGMSPARAQTAPGLPSGMTVVNGQVKAVTAGKQMTITNSSGSILNWQNFSIGAGNGVSFVQPNAQSSVLNRVVGNDPSSILGSLSSNGKVWLLNQNGVIFGQGARVDVAGLVTSTLNLNDNDWLSGRHTFTSGGSPSGIVNQGELRSSLGGHIALIGGSVRNEGLIEAKGGHIFLAAGKSVELVDTGSPNMRLLVTAPEGEALNLGTLAAAGGRIDVHAAVVNQQGVIRADSLEMGPSGNIVMRAGKALKLAVGSITSASGGATSAGGSISIDSSAEGTAMVSGDVLATGTRGGQIQVLGKHVGLVDAAVIDVSGTKGGGEALVGGGERGQDQSIRNSKAVFMASTASLKADAIESGDGGRLILWGDDTNRAYGSFGARGGSLSGNGGFIETSGGWIDIQPSRLDASATVGLSGTWLLDPYNILITGTGEQTGITRNDAPGSVSFTGTSTPAAIKSQTIIDALNSGNNVSVTTTTAGPEAGNINVIFGAFDVTLSNRTSVTLTLTAHRDIEFSGSHILSGASDVNYVFTSGIGALGGGISILNSTLQAGPGGLIQLGGPKQACGQNACPRLPGAQHSNRGIHISNSTLKAAGGSITLSGSALGQTALAGLSMSDSSIIAKDLVGYGFIDSSADASRHGIALSNSHIRAYNSISLDGEAHNAGQVYQNSAAKGVSIFRGSIELNPTGPGTPDNLKIFGLVQEGVVPFNPTGEGTSISTPVSVEIQQTALTVGGKAKVTINGNTRSASGAGRPSGTVAFFSSGNADLSGAGSLVITSDSSLGIGWASLALPKSEVANFIGRDVQIFDSTSLTGSPRELVLSASRTFTQFADSSLNLSGSGGVSINAPETILGLNGTSSQLIAAGPIKILTDDLKASASTMRSQATGNSIVIAGKTSQNADKISLGTLDAPNGHFSVYATNPSKTSLGTLVPSFTAYNERFEDTGGTPFPRVPPTQSGIYYSVAPFITLNNNGAISKNYDGTPSVLFSSGSNAITPSGLLQSGEKYLGIEEALVYSDKDAGVSKRIVFNSEGATPLVLDRNGKPVYGYRVTSNLRGDILPAPLTVTANDANKTYGATLGFTGSEFSSSGLKGTDTIGTVTLQAGGRAPNDAVGSYPIDASNARGGTFSPTNYNITYVSGKLTVSRGELRIVTGGVIGNPTKTYDSTATATLTPANYSLTGFAPGESASVNQTVGTYDRPDAGNRTVTVTLTRSNYAAGAGTDLDNYNLPTVVTGRGTIDTKLLTLVGLRADNKVYNGDNLANLSDSGSLSGLVGGQRLRVTNTSATFNDKDAGVGKTVTVSGVNLANLPGDTGDDAPLRSNYHIAPTASTTADIRPASLTITANDQTKPYNSELVFRGTEFTSRGLVGNETLSSVRLESPGAAKAATVEASPYPIVPSNALGSGGFSAVNYKIDYLKGSLMVSPLQLEVKASLTGNPTKVYSGDRDATLKASDFSLSGFVNNDGADVTKTTGTYDRADAGSRMVTVNLERSDFSPKGETSLRNYVLPNIVTGVGTINQKPVTLTQVSANSRDYDGSRNATLTGPAIFSGLVGNETLTLRGYQAEFDNKNVNVGKRVTVSQIDLGNGTGLASNYVLAPNNVTTTQADIRPASLKITANNQDKPYNNELVFKGTEFAANGLVGNETVSSVRLESAGAAKAATVEASPYPIVPSNPLGSGGFSVSNYKIDYANGSLMVSPLQLEAQAKLTGNPTKVYNGDRDATLKASDFSLSGFVNNDGADVTKTTGTYDRADAGSRMVTVNLERSDFSPKGETSLRNYVLPTSATGGGTIERKPVTLTQVMANSRDYNGKTDATLTGPAIFSGLVGNETLTLRGYQAEFDNKHVNVGKTVTVSKIDIGDGTGLASNYVLSPINVTTTTADINPKLLSFATVTAANKVYDSKPDAVVTLGDIVGLVDGETLGKSAVGTFNDQNVGTGKTVTVTSTITDGQNGSARNYRINSTSTTTAAIERKEVTFAGATAAGSKTYDGKTAAVVTLGGMNGLVGGETLTASATGNFVDKDAGVGKQVTIVASLGNGSDGSVASNYRLSQNTLSTTATIDPALVTASTVTAASRTYDGGTGAAVTLGPLTGLVGVETLSSGATGSFDNKNVGTGKRVDVTTVLQDGSNGGKASNYRIAPATTTADITQANLTYSATPASKVAGAPLPPLTGTVSGFVGTETQATATTGSLGFSTPAKTDSPAGSYAVDGGGLTAGNYRFIQAPGNATALSVTALPPEITSDISKTALSNSLTSVILPSTGSSPGEGRVADVTTSLQPASSTSTGSSFQRVSISSMSQDELIAMLNSRDRYKKNVFDVAIKQLEQDPKLADTAECASAADAESGSCVITEKVKNELRKQRAAALAAAEAVGSPPAVSPPARVMPPPPVAGARSTPAQIAAANPRPGTAATKVSRAREQAAIRRRILEASLPQIERKFAVVIGINDYEDDAIPGLDNSVGDARAIGQVLENQLGYETLYIENASKSRVIAALNKLAVEVGPKDSVVVYYAGHGQLIESSKLGYWQLADSDAKDPATWLSNSDISKMIGQIGASQIALISDSCYSGSLVDERIRSGSKLDPNSVLGVKSVVVMSSGGNEPVFDAGKDGHSPFAFSLINNLKSVANWQAGGNVFERVRFQVARELPQRPQYGSNATAGHQAGGDYLFEQRRSDLGTR